MAPDPIVATRSVLTADQAITALVGGRVFYAELPADEARLMPRNAIVISAAGGFVRWQKTPLGSPRLDVRCYGGTPYQAMQVYLAVYDVLKKLGRRVVGSTLLHSAEQEGGPIELRDPETNWPFIQASWSVILADQAVT